MATRPVMQRGHFSNPDKHICSPLPQLQVTEVKII